MPLVKDLVDDELDYWVARALGFTMERHQDLQMVRGAKRILIGPQAFQQRFAFLPSRDMAQAWTIMESRRIGVMPFDDDTWEAIEAISECQASGGTAMIAGMRTFVMMTFGQTVPNDFKGMGR